jgi:hypothetical protein
MRIHTITRLANDMAGLLRLQLGKVGCVDNTFNIGII